MTKSRGIRRRRGTGSMSHLGFLISENGSQRLQHVLMAEKVLGKELPKGVVVHHVDRNNKNNVPTNLVICPDQGYHMLLHTRQRAIDAGKPAHWRKCPLCKQFDDPKNMGANGKSFRHAKCISEYNRGARN